MQYAARGHLADLIANEHEWFRAKQALGIEGRIGIHVEGERLARKRRYHGKAERDQSGVNAKEARGRTVSLDRARDDGQKTGIQLSYAENRSLESWS